jgi:hypothetical protein
VIFDAWLLSFIVRNGIPKVALVDYQDWVSRLPGIDRLFDFASVTGKCPARVSTGTDHQIMSLSGHIRREGGPQFGDLIGDLFTGRLGGRACECEDSTVERDLRAHRADPRKCEGFWKSGFYPLAFVPDSFGEGKLNEVFEEVG